MTPLEIGGLGILALFALILLHVPIGFAMIIVGVVGYALQAGWAPAVTILASEPSGLLSSVDLATVPLFLLMGTFASAAGFSINHQPHRAAAGNQRFADRREQRAGNLGETGRYCRLCPGLASGAGELESRGP